MKRFTVEYELDLYEKLDGGELAAELAHVFQIAQKNPSFHHTLWEHPEGSVLFLIFGGPELTDANQKKFNAAVRKHLEE